MRSRCDLLENETILGRRAVFPAPETGRVQPYKTEMRSKVMPRTVLAPRFWPHTLPLLVRRKSVVIIGCGAQAPQLISLSHQLTSSTADASQSVRLLPVEHQE